jgi:hypothetical protein
MTFTLPSDRQRRRKELTEDIIEQVRAAVWEELAEAPDSFSREALDGIEETVMAHTRLVVDALGFQEMESEGARLSHIAAARWETQRLVRERRPPGGAGAGVHSLRRRRMLRNP